MKLSNMQINELKSKYYCFSWIIQMILKYCNILHFKVLNIPICLVYNNIHLFKLSVYPHHLLVVPTKNQNNSFDLFTQKFVGLYNNTSPILVNRYFINNESFETNAILYWDKRVNLEGRLLNVSSVQYPPYSVVERFVIYKNCNLSQKHKHTLIYFIARGYRRV